MTANFLKYLFTGILATITSTLILILTVDKLKIWVGYANPLTTGFIFFFKYAIYDKIGMLKNEH